MEFDNPEMGWRMKMPGVNYFKLMISYYTRYYIRTLYGYHDYKTNSGQNRHGSGVLGYINICSLFRVEPRTGESVIDHRISCNKYSELGG